MSLLLTLSFLLLSLAIVLTLGLFLFRSDPQNRAIAIELLAILSTAIIGVVVIQWQRTELLDVIVAWSLFGFIGTAALSKLLMADGSTNESSGKENTEHGDS